jgi:hypothetical protein
MEDLYRDYKPFRNFLHQFGLLDNLVHIWRYALFKIDKMPLPPNYIQGRPRFIDPEQFPYPWQLDLLVRELVLNAGQTGPRSLNNWNDIAHAINHVQRLDGAAFMLGNDGNPDVMLELHRIAHRQFPFSDIGIFPKVRAAKVLGTPEIDDLARRELGLSVQQSIWLGMAVAGHFNREWGLSTKQDYREIGLSADNTQIFFDRLTISMTDLRSQLVSLQRYDQTWAYTWNPLIAKPLIAIDPAHPERVICPIPHYLLNRAFGGLFYDLVNFADFSNLFGHSFQAYVGELLSRTCLPPRFSLTAPAPYLVSGSARHGVDWILSDNTGHAFIEAKTKRLTARAKMAPEPEALEKDLQTLAEAVAQNYQNIQDATGAKTAWLADGLPIFPLIATLEDWYIFSPSVKKMLDDRILAELVKKQIDLAVLDQMPWQIASAQELELASQVIAQVGVYPVMSAKTPAQQGWSMSPTLRDRFPEAVRNTNPRLFEADFLALLPSAARAGL